MRDIGCYIFALAALMLLAWAANAVAWRFQ